MPIYGHVGILIYCVESFLDHLFIRPSKFVHFGHIIANYVIKLTYFEAEFFTLLASRQLV